MTHQSQWSNGFTLIELLITVTIVLLLSSLAAPLAEIAVQRGKEMELRRNLREIRNAIDAYKQAILDGRIVRTLDASGYPETLEILSEGVIDAKSPQKTKIYFLRRIPRDPFSADPKVPAGATWGKRSYASDPTDPQEGSDVYDVFSRSAGVGLNGIPYRDW